MEKMSAAFKYYSFCNRKFEFRDNFKKLTLISYRLFTIAVFLLMGVEFAWAQQEPMYSQNNFDRLLTNPAYAGSSNWIVSSLKYRNQFVGIQGAPVTQTFTFHGPIQSKYMGYGLKLVNDKIGTTKQTNITAIYSYHLGLAGGRLSFGLEGGIFNQSTDFAGLVKKDQIDNALPSGNLSVLKPDASFGIQYQAKDFYGGFAVSHLFTKSINYSEIERAVTARLFRHYFLTGGYIYDINSNFSIQPNFLLKITSSAPMQLDFYTNFMMYEKFILGAGYRTGDALSFIAKYHITDELRISYSYDYTLSKLASYSSGAHEIMIRYGIKLLPPPAAKEIHPRYYF